MTTRLFFFPPELDASVPPGMVTFDEEGEAHVNWDVHASFEYDRAWSHTTRAHGVPVHDYEKIHEENKRRRASQEGRAKWVAEHIKAQIAALPRPKQEPKPKRKTFFIPWDLRRKLQEPSRKPKRAIFRTPETLEQVRADAAFMRHLGLYQQAQTHLAIYGLK